MQNSPVFHGRFSFHSPFMRKSVEIPLWMDGEIISRNFHWPFSTLILKFCPPKNESERDFPAAPLSARLNAFYDPRIVKFIIFRLKIISVRSKTLSSEDVWWWRRSKCLCSSESKSYVRKSRKLILLCRVEKSTRSTDQAQHMLKSTRIHHTCIKVVLYNEKREYFAK